VLIRADSGGGTHEFLAWLAKPGRRLAYSAGFTITADIQDAILAVPARAWTPAYDADGLARPGAWVAELTGMLDLPAWPERMRVIVREERPHPGAQLRFTDIDGQRFTCFATSTRSGQLADASASCPAKITRQPTCPDASAARAIRRGRAAAGRSPGAVRLDNRAT